MRLPDRIETGRLLIRPFVESDAGRFITFMTDDATMTEFMFEPEQKTPHGAREFFDAVIASYTTDTPYFFCVITRAGETGLIGTCGISNLPGKGVFECSVCVTATERRKGYATEAVRALADYCFDHYSIDTFRNYVSPRNASSLALAKRLGMAHAGSGSHPAHGDPCEIYELSRGASAPHRE